MFASNLKKSILLLSVISVLSGCDNSSDPELSQMEIDNINYKPTITGSTNGKKNTAPVANSDEFFGLEDQQLAGFNVLQNDTDLNGDLLEVTDYSQGINGGIVEATIDGRFIYTPLPNFYGKDEFTYTISDGKFKDSATVVIWVEGVNDISVNSEEYTLSANSVLDNMDLLANDVDVDGDILVVSNFSQGIQGGSVQQTENDLFRYVPPINFVGTDEFYYTVIDNKGGEITATVTLQITPAMEFNVVGESFSLKEDGKLENIDLLANDYTSMGSLSIISYSQGTKGGLVQQVSEGLFNYIPQKDFFGQEEFSYTVANESNMQATATVVLTVSPVDDYPVANFDNVSLTQSSNKVFSIIENDTGLGDGINISLVSLPTHGSVQLSSLGIATYQPESGYFGVDEFIYKIVDSDGDSSMATVTLNIECVLVCSQTFSLNWNHSVSEGVTGYKVYVGISPNNYDKSIDVDYSTNFTYQVSEKGTYYFAVSAINSQGVESELSSEVSSAF